ncbi:hypothetical protein BU26DRAFT_33303 [Trematosphaeria pertusa]|uniref:Uncharacterized protein n=1 Tax=Trematosphaeria pertusa TaxID=390896 RepID=A0A6A6J2N9_9PLEO|nr:uncharacterized protein BU26DRAFT_33303 [Trematosphaeria pertusa]KAF2256989.1 hypothetical protein BU26DRAFT_33303 [Trematosphaeria pertusa]
MCLGVNIEIGPDAASHQGVCGYLCPRPPIAPGQPPYAIVWLPKVREHIPYGVNNSIWRLRSSNSEWGSSFLKAFGGLCKCGAGKDVGSADLGWNGGRDDACLNRGCVFCMIVKRLAPRDRPADRSVSVRGQNPSPRIVMQQTCQQRPTASRSSTRGLISGSGQPMHVLPEMSQGQQPGARSRLRARRRNVYCGI